MGVTNFVPKQSKPKDSGPYTQKSSTSNSPSPTPWSPLATTRRQSPIQPVSTLPYPVDDNRLFESCDVVLPETSKRKTRVRTSAASSQTPPTTPPMNLDQAEFSNRHPYTEISRFPHLRARTATPEDAPVRESVPVPVVESIPQVHMETDPRKLRGKSRKAQEEKPKPKKNRAKKQGVPVKTSKKPLTRDERVRNKQPEQEATAMNRSELNIEYLKSRGTGPEQSHTPNSQPYSYQYHANAEHLRQRQASSVPAQQVPNPSSESVCLTRAPNHRSYSHNGLGTAPNSTRLRRSLSLDSIPSIPPPMDEYKDDQTPPYRERLHRKTDLLSFDPRYNIPVLRVNRRIVTNEKFLAKTIKKLTKFNVLPSEVDLWGLNHVDDSQFNEILPLLLSDTQEEGVARRMQLFDSQPTTEAYTEEEQLHLVLQLSAIEAESRNAYSGFRYIPEQPEINTNTNHQGTNQQENNHQENNHSIEVVETERITTNRIGVISSTHNNQSNTVQSAVQKSAANQTRNSPHTSAPTRVPARSSSSESSLSPNLSASLFRSLHNSPVYRIPEPVTDTASIYSSNSLNVAPV